MAQTYTSQVHGDPEEEFKQVKELARTRGMTLSGDSRAATLSGRAEGSHTRSGTTATVVLTDKFFLLSWASLESDHRGLARILRRMGSCSCQISIEWNSKKDVWLTSGSRREASSRESIIQGLRSRVWMISRRPATVPYVTRLEYLASETVSSPWNRVAISPSLK